MLKLNDFYSLDITLIIAAFKESLVVWGYSLISLSQQRFTRSNPMN